jgi:hypothetical protein
MELRATGPWAASLVTLATASLVTLATASLVSLAAAALVPLVAAAVAMLVLADTVARRQWTACGYTSSSYVFTRVAPTSYVHSSLSKDIRSLGTFSTARRLSTGSPT